MASVKISTAKNIEEGVMNSNLNVTERAEALRSGIYSIASDMPKQACPPLAEQLSDSVTRIIDLMYVANDRYINQNDQAKRELLQKNVKSEIKMLSLLAQLAFERKIITLEQFEDIAQKTTECKQILFYDVFH